MIMTNELMEVNAQIDSLSQEHAQLLAKVLAKSAVDGPMAVKDDIDNQPQEVVMVLVSILFLAFMVASRRRLDAAKQPQA